MRKKWLAVLLAIIAFCSVVSISPKTAAADMTIVRVLLSTSGQQEIVMRVDGSYTVQESARIFVDGTLTLKGAGSLVTVTHSSEGELYTGRSVTIERNNLARNAGGLRFSTKYGTRTYLGHFTITSKDGVLSVVNRVPMSHYLYGVVGHEMSDSWPLEALKAQAIAAKCYAMLNRSSSGSYDLGDTSAHQVYKGYTASNLNVIQAVDDTNTRALFYGGQVMRCYYAASNGGYMVRPSSVWNGPKERWDDAYGEGYDEYDMKNPASPREALLVPFSFGERQMNENLYRYLNAKIAEAALQAGVIPAGYTYTAALRIDSIVSTTEAGATDGIDHDIAHVKATVVAAFDPTGAAASPTPAVTPVPAPTATPAMTQSPETNQGADNSPTDTPESTASPAPTEAPTATPVPSATPAPTASPAQAGAIVPADGQPLTVEAPVSFTFRLDELESDTVRAFTNGSLRLAYATSAADGFCLMHVRYGHGVGMSQRGAEQMAKEGKTYQEILAYYYPGGELAGIDYISPESPAALTPPPTLPGTVALGSVKSDLVNVRKGAATTTKRLGQLSIGASVTLTGLFGDWYQIFYPDTGGAAYVHSDYIAVSGSGVIARGFVDSSAVNLRAGPGTTYETLGQLSKTTPVGIMGVENGWYRLVALGSGQEGYMLKKYVTVTEKEAGVRPAQSTPVPSAAPGTTPDPVQTQTPVPPTPMPTITPVPTPTPTPAPTPVRTASPGPYTAHGTVNASAVNFRQGASISTASYGRLGRGEALGIYEKVGAWYRACVLSSGQSGYIYAKYVTLTPADGAAAPESAGTLNTSAVNLRKGPGTAYSSLGRLSRGTKVSVLGSSGSWYRVRVADTGLEGYVFSRYVSVASREQPPGTKQGIVTALINLRTLPAVDEPSRVLMTVAKGEVVTVHSTANGWCFVTYQGTTGYCIASCVSVG